MYDAPVKAGLWDKFFLNASFLLRKTVILNQWWCGGGGQRWHQNFFLLILGFFPTDLKSKNISTSMESICPNSGLLIYNGTSCFLSLGIWNGILSHHGIDHGNIHELFLWAQCSVLMLTVTTICRNSLWNHPKWFQLHWCSSAVMHAEKLLYFQAEVN